MAGGHADPNQLDPEAVEWDAVVIGTGVGGATLGYELARAGRRTLNLDKLPAAGYGSTSASSAAMPLSVSSDSAPSKATVLPASHAIRAMGDTLLILSSSSPK